MPEVTTEWKLDPRNLIDRHAEQTLFRELVTCETDARMLTICDRGGRGKSSLLRRLRFNCHWEIHPPVPCCLIELDQIEPSPWGFAQAVASGFTVRAQSIRDQFAKFEKLDLARTKKDFTPFDEGDGPPAVHTAAADSPARLSGHAAADHVQGDNIGVFVERYEVQNAEFTQDQERRARERCVEALFDDLRVMSAKQPMVLLLDVWERCNLELRDWIFGHVLGNHLFNESPNLRPEKLSVVIAGRPYEPGVHGLMEDEFRPLFASDAAYDAAAKSIKSLSEWDSNHVQEFMKINGRPEPTEAEVNLIREKLAAGWPLEKILSLLALVASQ